MSLTFCVWGPLKVTLIHPNKTTNTDHPTPKAPALVQLHSICMDPHTGRPGLRPQLFTTWCFRAWVRFGASKLAKFTPEWCFNSGCNVSIMALMGWEAISKNASSIETSPLALLHNLVAWCFDKLDLLLESLYSLDVGKIASNAFSFFCPENW